MTVGLWLALMSVLRFLFQASYAGAVLFATAWLPQGQTTAPLPEPSAFLQSVRADLFTDEELQRNYTYFERREEIRVSRLGKVHLRVRLFEVYPSPEPGHRYRRLVAENDRPLDPAELARRDAEYLKYVSDLRLERERETPAARTRREAREQADRSRRDAIVDDVFRVFEMRLLRRETVDGHPAIAVSLTPRRGVTPSSRPGRYFQNFEGTAWVHEADRQVMRVSLECIRTVNVGWGLLGRVHEGSRFTFERRKVNDEVWLPSRTEVELRGRSLLVRRFDVTAVTRFSGYRKFTVSTHETFTPTRPGR